MLSISGDRPPWTHRTAPPGFDAEPLLDEVAPVPAGPVFEGLLGTEDSVEGFGRGKRFMT